MTFSNILNKYMQDIECSSKELANASSLSQSIISRYKNGERIPTNDNLKKISDEIDCKMFILSSCLFKEQAVEKDLWLDKYMPFIKKENRIFILSENFEARKKLKIYWTPEVEEKVRSGAPL